MAKKHEHSQPPDILDHPHQDSPQTPLPQDIAEEMAKHAAALMRIQSARHRMKLAEAARRNGVPEWVFLSGMIKMAFDSNSFAVSIDQSWLGQESLERVMQEVFCEVPGCGLPIPCPRPGQMAGCTPGGLLLAGAKLTDAIEHLCPLRQKQTE